MKNYIALLLLFAFTLSFSQIPDLKRRFNDLNPKIVKVETSTYALDNKLNKYVLSTNTEYNYNSNGYLTRSKENNFGSDPNSNTFTYSYNKDDQMDYFDMVYKNFKPERTTYKYEKGNLIEIVGSGRYGTTTTFEYDENGELSKEKTKNSKGESISNAHYEYFKDNDNYRKETSYILEGEIDRFSNLKLENGKKTIDTYVVFHEGKTPTLSIATYKYDKYGNVIEKKIDTDEYPKTYDLVYDKFGEIIKSHTKERYMNSRSFTQYCYFTKYTYQDGTSSGSKDLDKDFAKKYLK